MPVIGTSKEDTLQVDTVHTSGNDETTRARVRGLSHNPALPDTLVPRMLEHPAADVIGVMNRPEWSDEVFDIVAAHPEARIRTILAQCAGATVEQRVRMIDDPDRVW